MYSVTIYDLKTNRKWDEKYDSFYSYRKRIMKLRYSKRLIVLKTKEEK